MGSGQIQSDGGMAGQGEDVGDALSAGQDRQAGGAVEVADLVRADLASRRSAVGDEAQQPQVTEVAALVLKGVEGDDTHPASGGALALDPDAADDGQIAAGVDPHEVSATAGLDHAPVSELGRTGRSGGHHGHGPGQVPAERRRR